MGGVVLALAVMAAAQQGAPKITPKLRALDRSEVLMAGQQKLRFITHVQRVEGPGQADETTEWWELRDAADRVVYRQSYEARVQDGGFESTVGVGARAFNTNQGSGVLVEGMDLPSAPNAGTWVQVFGFKYGTPKDASTLIPFGPPMYTDGELLDITTDPRKGAAETPGRTVIVMKDILTFRVWTGNFNITYPVLINWITGKVQPAWRCVRTTTRGQVERCSYPVTVEPVRAEEMTFVRLFPEPDEGFTAKHIVVKAASKIEYVEAEAPVSWQQDEKSIQFGVHDAGQVWLRIRIDGQEGWIHSEEDFAAVGLPQSG